jgi:thiamine biosynthesis lipoprotein ApbE
VKSYIIDHATKKVIEETGLENVIMNIGGDILVAGNQ